MEAPPRTLQHLIDRAKASPPIRVAVADAAQPVVIAALRDAYEMGLVEPILIGDATAIDAACREVGWTPPPESIVPAASDAAAALKGAELVKIGAADAVMKGNLHTDTLMQVLLDKDRGLRASGRRVSHVFVFEVPSRAKLLGVTDAAINIAPDLAAKAQILQNAVELFTLLGIEWPKVAAVSAVETINPAIVSTLDAAALTLMARRGQIHGAVVDGPLALDNAVSADAAREKGIVSEVAGDADILLVPDLVSGNMIAKELQFLAGAVAVGVVVGLAAPVVLTSRADPRTARLASLALAALMHHRMPKVPPKTPAPQPSLQCSPQPEHACAPLPG